MSHDADWAARAAIARPLASGAAPAAVPAPPATLKHIAIIPDGNRRWAAARGMPVWDGVRTGVKTAEATFEAIRRRNIPWCTFWASSYDNLVERPQTERGVLNELFADWFTHLAVNETVQREQVRIRVLGEWSDLLEKPAREAIVRALEATAAHEGPALTFLVGYDGDRELVAATKALLQAVGSGPARTRHNFGDVGGSDAGRQWAVDKQLTLDDLRANAWTKEIPTVDLVIRTGSWADPHRSANFLPLLTSNVQESYPEVYWPDFSDRDLDEVVADFARRERRLGK